MHYKILLPASLELKDAIDYYENEFAGLGSEFLDEVEKSLTKILDYPSAWRIISENNRSCRLRRFPYSLIYAQDGNLIIITAISHHKRKPNYWKDRL